MKKYIILCIILLPLLGGVVSAGILGNNHVLVDSFKDFFKDNLVWELEYDVGSGWQNGNQYLEIEKTYIEGLQRWKWNLIFNNPSNNVDRVRFTFAVDKDGVNGSIDKVNETLYMSIGGFNIYFDYSDLMAIPGLEFSYGRLPGNDWFWFRFLKNGNPHIPQGVHEFDPWFGNNQSRDSGQHCENRVQGSSFTLPTTYDFVEAQNITVFIYTNNDFNVTCGLYLNSTRALLGQTETITINTNSGYEWRTFNFSSPVNLSSYTGQEILIVGHSNASGSLCSMATKNINGFSTRDAYTWDGSLPDPFVEVSNVTNYVYNIYCSFLGSNSTADEGDDRTYSEENIYNFIFSFIIFLILLFIMLRTSSPVNVGIATVVYYMLALDFFLFTNILNRGMVFYAVMVLGFIGFARILQLFDKKRGRRRKW